MILFTLILLPFSYLMLGLLLKRPKIKRQLALVFASANLVWTLVVLKSVNLQDIIVVNMGSWPAPYGISLVADRFSAFMLLLAAFVFLLVTVYSTQSLDKERRKNGYFFYSFGILLGVNGSFIAGDIFNLYVWFEVMLISSFILMGLGGERKQLEGSIKYLILNLIGSMFFVAGIGLLYGKIGSLNMADISYKMSLAKENLAALNPALILIFVGFAIKGALFPFFFWLPASYH
ncbi:MAG TPA: pH regulation protein D, partial [Marinilabiliaceae bacterium]|nr:pH regulation protein D [Marinilabiliaceae bacterium]